MPRPSFRIPHFVFPIPHCLALVLAGTASAQLAPEAAYVFPAGGRAGTTLEVRLGGYELTPDVQYFVHDRRVKLEILGPPGELLIPPPPYWFGGRSRVTAVPLPREVPARLTLPADLPPGPVRWQAANANGATDTGVFVVGDGPEVVEDERPGAPRPLLALPVTVSGRLLKNEEVDTYRVRPAADGPVTCVLTARRLGANFHGVIEVRDATGRLVAEAVDTVGDDPAATFYARADSEYTVAVRDIDHAGDRSYVYRLAVTAGPRVLAALPAAGRRGETCEVTFVGVGVASGRAELERVTRRVTFPTAGDSLAYRLGTPFGTAPPWVMPLDDIPPSRKSTEDDPRARRLVVPAAVTGQLAGGEDRFTIAAARGELIRATVQARRLGSPLDVTLAVRDANGKELARADDLPGTTDAGLDFTAPADGAYELAIADAAGTAELPAAVYRLVLRRPADDFALHLSAPRLSVAVGDKASLTVKVTRSGAFKGPVALALAGLPPGVRAPDQLVIPADKAELAVPLEAAADAATGATLVSVTGTADVGGRPVTRTARAPAAGNLAPRAPEEAEADVCAVAVTLKPRVKGEPVDKDTGRKVPRGSTFPAEVTLQRLEGFQGEIELRMAARQSYQVQGITGGTVIVPPGATKALYPCFMPEWLETSRTSRMGIVSVVKVADPKGNVRHLVAPIAGFVTMTMEGALLKVSHDGRDLAARPGQSLDLRVRVARSPKLTEPVRVELLVPPALAGRVRCEPVTVPYPQSEATLRVTTPADPALTGIQALTVRATALRDGQYLVRSECTVAVEFTTGAAAGR